MLRNNFAKRFLMQELDVYTLSRILNHFSVKVTEKAYLDLDENRKIIEIKLDNCMILKIKIIK